MAISNTMTKSSCFVTQELLLFLLKANAQLRCLVDCALCIGGGRKNGEKERKKEQDERNKEQDVRNKEQDVRKERDPKAIKQ